MSRKLSLRLDALESAATSIPKPTQDSKEDALRRKKVMRRLAELIEESKTGIKVWEKLSQAGQVRYWKQRIKELQETVKLGVDGIHPTPNVHPGVDLSMRELTVRIAPKQLAETQEQLAKLLEK